MNMGARVLPTERQCVVTGFAALGMSTAAYLIFTLRNAAGIRTGLGLWATLVYPLLGFAALCAGYAAVRHRSNPALGLLVGCGIALGVFVFFSAS
ncbi:hypothetical protein D7X96_14950 [Corallococcus interemptor]|uniref:Uncharacterized protein n=1 Tax=Corallococcus interemptor TaxID=2316720 RepID=A0A3A8QLM4_9BACT|nr:hypothetical protein [Corallococcus interemptor]RKH69437.1 hypothetical protein D7X96_14950 [Corallococcus interemptor]